MKWNPEYWFDNARYVALPQSLLPASVAVFMAGGDPHFSLTYGLLALFGVMSAHLSMNLFDDYFDYQVGGVSVRNDLNDRGIRSRIAKSPYLASGEVTPKQLFGMASLFSVIALAFGTVIFVRQGLEALYIALAAGFLGYFYSGRPLRLGYHGLGEIVIGLVFGPLLMCGVYFSACGRFSPPIAYVSAALGLLVANIVYTHSIMDMAVDAGNRKKTLATILKRPGLRLAVSAAFNFLPYIVVLAACMARILAWHFVSVFLFLPLSAYLFHMTAEFVRHPRREFRRRWWMGPFDVWDEVVAAGIDWFLIRWYTARNISVFFSLAVIVCTVVSYFVS